MKHIHVLLDNVRSAYNTGSIFRTSETSGIEYLHLCGITPYPPHIKLEKTALGTLERVHWDYAPSSIQKAQELQIQGIPLISVEIDPRAVSYDTFTYPETFCLVMGHELMGVHPDILDISDAIVQIPMYGEKNSLNVSVSFGIVIYESIAHGNR